MATTFSNTATVSKQNIDPDFSTYETGLSTPLSTGQRTLLNKLFLDLKAGLSITLLSEVFDFAYLFANETAEAALRNIAKRAHDGVAVNNPTFTAFEGYTGVDTAYIDTNYNPKTQGVRYTQNDCSIGTYIRNNRSASEYEICCYDGTIYSRIGVRAPGSVYAFLNTNNVTYNNKALADSSGLWITTRNGSAITDQTIYQNKTDISPTRTGTAATGTIPSKNVYVLGINNNGSLGSYSQKQQAFVFYGKHITTTMRDAIVDAVEKYMDANGKGVIAYYDTQAE